MNDVVEQIKETLDIAEYIGKFIKLTQRGKNFFGLCPFHNEKTPSFSVNPDMKIFKCFGCGESGDIFSFVQKYNHTDFPEALEILAEAAGINLEKYSTQNAEYNIKKIFYEINERVANFYHKTLLSPIGEKARFYLNNRGLTQEVWNDFKIGYAPAQRFFLINQLKKHYDLKTILNSGLNKPGMLSDKFFDRIIFPITDSRGKIIGFSGRVIDKTDKRPKYLNSPETAVFKKRYNLFGLKQASQEIIKQKFAILVEGQTDVISSHNIGIKNTVAPLGTSLTKEQVDLLKKYTDTIVICFDNDTAGQKALIRATNIIHEDGLIAKAVPIPYGKDVDECIRHNKNLWLNEVPKAKPVIEYLLATHSLESINDKKSILNIVVPMLKNIKDPVVFDFYINIIANKLKISTDTVRHIFSEYKDDSNYTNLEHILKSDSSILKKEFYYLAILIQNRVLQKVKYFIDPKYLHDPFDKILQLLIDNPSKIREYSEKRIIQNLNSFILPTEDVEFLKKEIFKLKNDIQTSFIKNQISKYSNDKSISEEEKTVVLKGLLKSLSDLQKNY